MAKSIFIILAFIGFMQTIDAQNPFDIPANNSTVKIDSSRSVVSDSAVTINMVPDSSSMQPEVQSQNNPFDINRSNIISLDTEDRGVQTNPPSRGKTPGLLQIDTDFLVLIYSLVMLVIITMAISMNKARFITIVKSTASSNQIRTLYRDTRAWTNGQSLLLYLIFFFNAAFIIWLANAKLNLFQETRFFLILLAVFLIYLFRHFIMWLIGAIYPVENQATTHSYSIALHNKAFGVVILPFILGLEYISIIPMRTTVLVLLGIFLINYLLRQGKSALMALGSRGFNLFYFFLYLCAIEIAPYLVAYKLLIGAL